MQKSRKRRQAAATAVKTIKATKSASADGGQATADLKARMAATAAECFAASSSGQAPTTPSPGGPQDVLCADCLEEFPDTIIEDSIPSSQPHPAEVPGPMADTFHADLKILEIELAMWKNKCMEAQQASSSSASSAPTPSSASTVLETPATDMAGPHVLTGDVEEDKCFEEFWNELSRGNDFMKGTNNDEMFVDIEKQLKTCFMVPDIKNDKSETDGLETALSAAVMNNTFDIRGSLGQRFNKSHPKGSELHTKYHQNKTWESKRLFRIDWAKDELKRIKVTKSHGKVSRTIDKNKGVYKPFACLVEGQGYNFDPKGAVRRASRYTSKCLRLGPPFCSINNMTDTLEFLEVKREHTEEFEEIWSTWREESSEGDKKIADAIKEEVATGTCSGDGAKPPSSKPKPSPKQTPKPKNKLTELLSQAKAVKNKYQTVTSQAAALSETINNGSKEWRWAANEDNHGELLELQKTLQSKLSPSLKTFLITETRDLTKRFGDEYLTTLLKDFLDIDGDIENLAKGHKKLMARYAAGTSASPEDCWCMSHPLMRHSLHIERLHVHLGC